MYIFYTYYISQLFYDKHISHEKNKKSKDTRFSYAEYILYIHIITIHIFLSIEIRNHSASRPLIYLPTCVLILFLFYIIIIVANKIIVVYV